MLVQQLGAPVPATPLLLLAGAHAADDPMYGVYALVLSIFAGALGSVPWFWAGRRYGYRVLAFMCRISLSPDSCVRQTENVFERYGAASLLVGKFIPGFAGVAPPLAATFGFSALRFHLLYGAGTALWAGVALVVGLVFSTEIDWLMLHVAAIGTPATIAVAGLVALYVAYRWVVRRQFLKSLRAARIGVTELKEMMQRGEAPIVLDVRSRTHRKLDGRRIPGALEADVEDLGSALARIPAGRNVVVYCACPNDATAMKVAKLLKRRGIRDVRPLAGGFDAWIGAGLTTDR